MKTNDFSFNCQASFHVFHLHILGVTHPPIPKKEKSNTFYCYMHETMLLQIVF